MKIQALNGSSDKLTLTALKTAAGQATGKARATIQGLIRSLSPQPAARGRSAKGASVKKHHKRAAKKVTARRKKKHNPTTAPKAHKVHRWHAKKRTTRHNPSKGGGFGAKLNTSSILEAVKEGSLVALGALGSSFVERQTERFLPNLNPLLRGLVASGVVAGVGIYFGGSYGKHVAAGSIAEFVRSAGREYMPSLFAGTDDPDSIQGVATGYWDENNQWVEMAGADDYAGLSYTLSDGVPTSALRPAGI